MVTSQVVYVVCVGECVYVYVIDNSDVFGVDSA